MLHFYRTPKIFKYLSRNLIWEIPTKSNEIYLTFDDGPIPDLTEYILDVLDDFNAKATFFCVGENILKYSTICERIIKEGHAIGNHTFNHIKGWSVRTAPYIENIEKCQELISSYQQPKEIQLFRPPYGKITFNQIENIKGDYRIIMWDILAYDFINHHAPEISLKKILEVTSPGSIVVFHDNYKAENKLKYMLPRYLKYFKENGFVFKKIDTAAIVMSKLLT